VTARWDTHQKVPDKQRMALEGEPAVSRISTAREGDVDTRRLKPVQRTGQRLFGRLYRLQPARSTAVLDCLSLSAPGNNGGISHGGRTCGEPHQHGQRGRRGHMPA